MGWRPLLPLLPVPALAARHSGQRSRDLVTLMDIVPAFCDFPITPPAEARSVSLRPSRSGVEQPRPYVTCHPRFDSAARQGQMLRTEPHKYVVFDLGQSPEQLFDLLTIQGSPET